MQKAFRSQRRRERVRGCRNVSARARVPEYAVLALAPGASNDQILAAHPRLILRFHPDRGGSDYLAAKIDQGKDLLLKEASA